MAPSWRPKTLPNRGRNRKQSILKPFGPPRWSQVGPKWLPDIEMHPLKSLLKLNIFEKLRLGGLRARFWRLRASILEPPGLDFGGSRPRFSSLQANMRRKNCFNGIYTISIRDLYFHALNPLRPSNDPAHKFPPPFFVLALTHADCARCPQTWFRLHTLRTPIRPAPTVPIRIDHRKPFLLRPTFFFNIAIPQTMQKLS